MPPFNGSRLRLLRRFHNLTQRGLAELVGTAPSAIATYERGTKEPRGIVLEALCGALQVTPEFLSSADNDDEFHEAETNFRSLQSTPDRLRKQVLAHTSLYAMIVQELGSTVKLPELKLPRHKATTRDEIESAAESCRIALGVGADAPIHNVVSMLEHAGVFVTTLRADIGRAVDAFSRFGNTSVIVLNPAKNSASRARFDLAHETGHGVLHRDGTPTDLSEREAQANYFAGALLMPKRSFAREVWAIGPDRSWDRLIELKQRWGVSIPAIVIRAYHLGLIDAAEYRRRYKFMSRAGWLSGAEPGDLEPERPQLFTAALRKHLESTGTEPADLATKMGLTEALFESVTGIDPAAAPIHSITSLSEYRERRLSVN